MVRDWFPDPSSVQLGLERLPRAEWEVGLPAFPAGPKNAEVSSKEPGGFLLLTPGFSRKIDL